KFPHPILERRARDAHRPRSARHTPVVLLERSRDHFFGELARWRRDLRERARHRDQRRNRAVVDRPCDLPPLPTTPPLAHPPSPIGTAPFFASLTARRVDRDVISANAGVP